MNKQTNNRWMSQNNGEVISENRTLICKQCGNKQTYCSNYSYRRAMGIAGLGKSDKKENGGLCGKCRRSAKRKPHGNRTPEQVNKMRETAVLNQTPYDSVEEWSKSKDTKDSYYQTVDTMSRTNLRLYNPKEYKRYMSNKYDGTNYETGLTIEHETPKSVCLKEGWSVEKASHIDNLKVVTQKENNRLWAEYAKNNNLVVG